MGLSEFSMYYSMVLLIVIYLVTPIGSNIRENTGVSLSLGKLSASFKQLITRKNHNTGSDNSDNDGEDQEVSDGGGFDKKKLIKDGLKIMAVDLVLQGATLVTVYLALIHDPAVGFQITALVSQLPKYGYAYSFGLAMMVKIAGARLIAVGAYDRYIKFGLLALIAIILFVPVIVFSIYNYTSEIAYESGSNACEYAYNEECGPFFTSVFGKNATGGTFMR
jgi:hypothetical protein